MLKFHFMFFLFFINKNIVIRTYTTHKAITSQKEQLENVKAPVFKKINAKIDINPKGNANSYLSNFRAWSTSCPLISKYTTNNRVNKKYQIILIPNHYRVLDNFQYSI